MIGEQAKTRARFPDFMLFRGFHDVRAKRNSKLNFGVDEETLQTL